MGTPSVSRPNCWWPSCAPMLKTLMSATSSSDSTGKASAWPCTLSSLTPTMCAPSSVSARRTPSLPSPPTVVLMRLTALLDVAQRLTGTAALTISTALPPQPTVPSRTPLPPRLLPTCEDCTGAVNSVGDVIESEAKVAEIMDFLKGDAYCGSLGDADCVAVIDALMPYAMPTLAALLRERAAQFCCDLSTGGICC